jgi:hypothetical protein
VGQKNRAKLIDTVSQLISEPSFVERHKISPKHFIRDRVFSFKITVLFLINILKESIQSELDNFFGKIEASDTKINKVTSSAFTQARAKLKHTAFIEMNDTQAKFFYENSDYKTWNGYRLVAVDGSSLRLPSTEETQKEFGVNEEKFGEKIVVARISEAFDPLNHIVIDSCISPFTVSEQSMMLQHIDKMSKGDLAIYDRNYPGFWVYKLHQNKEIDFCIRVQIKGRGKYIEDFVASGKREAIVDVKATTSESKLKCEELGLDTEHMKCRLIRIELKSGETEVLITSLLDTEKFTHECFKALYHLRWPVEEDYKLMKCRLELGNFSGKTALAIYQDFYAKVFMANLTSILAFDASIEIEEKKASCKYPYSINWNNAVQNMKRSGFLLFIRENYHKILDCLHELFQVKPVPYRTDRTFVRKKRGGKTKQFSMCYK